MFVYVHGKFQLMKQIIRTTNSDQVSFPTKKLYFYVFNRISQFRKRFEYAKVGTIFFSPTFGVPKLISGVHSFHKIPKESVGALVLTKHLIALF